MQMLFCRPCRVLEEQPAPGFLQIQSSIISQLHAAFSDSYKHAFDE